jgi:hypothetical protein
VQPPRRAEANGRVEDLVAGAVQATPGNARLRTFADGCWAGSTIGTLTRRRALAGRLSGTNLATGTLVTADPAANEARYDVFLSCRHADPDKKFARPFLRDLEDAGFKVATDDRDFSAQAKSLEELERGIKESRLRLAVLDGVWLQTSARVSRKLFRVPPGLGFIPRARPQGVVRDAHGLVVVSPAVP